MKLYAPTQTPVSIGLTSGHMHVVTFDGTETPAMFRREAIANGCLTSPEERDTVAPVAEFVRADVIKAQIEAMMDGDNEGDFKADGTPNLNALSKRCGFTVTRDEADAIFKAFSEQG